MIRLGHQVRDRVTGFEGIATARLEYLNGCVQYAVAPRIQDGETKLPEREWSDVGQLEVIGEGLTVPQRDTGGPVHGAPTRYRG